MAITDFSQTVYREAALLTAFDRSYLADPASVHRRHAVAANWAAE